MLQINNSGITKSESGACSRFFYALSRPVSVYCNTNYGASEKRLYVFFEF